LDIIVIITEFKNQLKALGYADTTIESYRENLNWFVKYLNEQDITDLRKVNHETILNYQKTVMEKPFAMESKALRLRPVKRLFEYLVNTHKLLINPTEGIIETNRKNRKIGPVLTMDEVKKLMAQPNLSLRPHIRNRTIMELLYSTGIRINELVSLEVYHVDLKEKVVYIRKGKGRKQRVVPMGKTAVKHLKEYLTHIRPWWVRHNKKERKLFLNHHGNPLTGDSVRSFLRKYRIAAKIKKSVSPHTFRRTCATHMLQQGADIVYIQKLLGHRYLSTTQFYTKVIPTDIKKTHEKTHPGIKDKDNED
jgi:integrase/recombinase XerD